MKFGTVVITGATGQVGQRLLSSLQGKCQASIALVRTRTNLPATEVISDWTNSAKAQAAISQADAVIHLAGSLKPDRGDYVCANIKTTEKVVSALSKGQTKRIVFLSYIGASEYSPNAYLCAKAQAERILQASGFPITIFRCTHLIGPPDNPGPTAENLLSKNGKAVVVLGSGRQKAAPVYVDDVISAIMSALDHNQSGVFDLAGSECFSMDELVKLLNQNASVKINHIPPFVAKLLPWIIRDLPPALVDVMLSDSISNPQHSIEAFDLKLTPLREIWTAA